MSRRPFELGGVLIVLALAGCDDELSSTASGVGGASSTDAATTTVSVSVSASVSVSVSASVGSTTSTGAGLCAPGEPSTCYDGPPETLGVGPCAAGQAICLADGSGFGPCSGATLPGAESCASAEDEDCDGVADEGCACVPGTIQSCYTGPSGTQGVGACVPGSETCAADGLSWGPCVGDVLPALETCASLGDEDCDGFVNEEGVDCLCVPGAVQSCYSGPMGTLGVGPCAAGSQTCNSDGLGFGPCGGETLPANESCLTAADDDCDGAANESGAGCVCTPNSTMSCYTGPAGTLGVGACMAGTSTCNALGTAQGSCVGQVVPSFDACATPEDEDCNGTNATCSTGHIWSKSFGGSGNQQLRGIASDGFDDVLLTGYFQGTVDFGGGPMSGPAANGNAGFVASLDASGNYKWSKLFTPGANQAVLAEDVAADAVGNVYVTGSFSGTTNFGGGAVTSQGATDIFLTKFDVAGTHVWTRTWGNASAQGGIALATDLAGNVLLAANAAGAIDFGTGVQPGTSADINVVKLTPAGVAVWHKRFTSTAFTHNVLSIAVDAAGDVAISGNVAGTIDFGGGPLTPFPSIDAYFAKFDASGNHLLSKRFGPNGDQYGNAVGLDAAGNVYLSGQCYSPIDLGSGVLPCNLQDIYVGKFDPSGALSWAHAYGDGADQDVNDMCIDKDGNPILAGPNQGTVDFGGGPLTSGGFTDAYLAKFTPAGGLGWARQAGDPTRTENAVAVTSDSTGSIVVAGIFGDTVDWGGGPLTSAGTIDIFVAKLAP